MFFKLNITKYDIEKGDDHNQIISNSCPVARAIKKHKAKDVMVGYNVFSFIIGDYLYLGKNPKCISNFISMYDSFGTTSVKPFTCSINARKVQNK